MGSALSLITSFKCRQKRFPHDFKYTLTGLTHLNNILPSFDVPYKIVDGRCYRYWHIRLTISISLNLTDIIYYYLT